MPLIHYFLFGFYLPIPYKLNHILHTLLKRNSVSCLHNLFTYNSSHLNVILGDVKIIYGEHIYVKDGGFKGDAVFTFVSASGAGSR